MMVQELFPSLNSEFDILGTLIFTLLTGSFKAGKNKFTCKKTTVTEDGGEYCGLCLFKENEYE